MNRRMAELTDEQIGFIGTSLDFSADKFRNYDYSPMDHRWAMEHRREQIEMIASIREALKEASRASVG